jgi:hypothetical protein
MPDHPVSPNPFSAPQSELSQSQADLTNAPANLTGFVRTGQMIAGSMAFGLTIIAGIFVFLLLSRDQPRGDNDPVYLLIGGGAFGMSLIATLLVPSVLRAKARDRLRAVATGTEINNEFGAAPQQPPSNLLNWEQQTTLSPPLRKFLADQQTANLIGHALLEGAGVMNAVFFLLSENWMSLAFVALAILGILMQMPTANKLRSRIRIALDPTATSF